MGVNIIDADNQPGTFPFLNHGGVHLNVYRLFLHDQTIGQSEQSAPLNLIQNIFFRKHSEEIFDILGMIEQFCGFAHGGEKILSLLGLRKIFNVVVRSAEFVIIIGFRIHHINAQIVSGQGVQPGIHDLLFPNPLFCKPPLHQFIDIRYCDDNIAGIIFHAGDLHLHIERFPVFDAAVSHFKNI